MGRKLFVGNLGYAMTDAGLSQLFEPHGVVCSAEVVIDADSGRSKGLGYVKMATNADAESAITALQGRLIDGRKITVASAKSQDEPPDLPHRYGNGRSGRGGGRHSRPLISDLE
jgi:RNA recognition motif-containing protein